MNYFELTKQEFVDIILGKTTYRKCPLCDQNGIQYWDNVDGGDIQSYRKPEWGDEYNAGCCENCEGLGFIPSTLQN